MDDVTASHLRSLEQHPGWKAYMELADEMCNTQMERFWKANMVRTTGGISEGELQYKRGLLKGIQLISRTPRMAREDFEKAFANQEDEASG